MASEPQVSWYPAHPNNYTEANRPSSNPINKVIIHMVQGSWSSALNYFQNPNAYVSAHFTVRSSDGYIGQSVSEINIAYHAGNYSYNETSVGIEHEGYVSDPSWFTEAMYEGSARLSAYLCDTFSIPIDRSHIIGHNEVPGATHTDPGGYWDWSYYMGLVREYSTGGGDSQEGYERVVDNADSGRFRASGNWGLSTYSSDRYGDNYRYTRPAFVSDLAEYKFDIPESGAYAIYGYWPANPGYNSSTPIGIRTSSGIEWIRVDQRQGGGRFNYLGEFNLSAGDDYKVLISRWTGGSAYIIADAIKVVRR